MFGVLVCDFLLYVNSLSLCVVFYFGLLLIVCVPYLFHCVHLCPIS